MDMQRENARKRVKEMSFAEKLGYFWDYYKVHTIVAIISILLIIVTVYQVSNRETYDLNIAYYGSVKFTEEQADKIKEYLSQHINDINSDGEKNTRISITNTDAGTLPADTQAVISQKFTAELVAGTYNVYIFDEEYNRNYGYESDLNVISSSFDMKTSEVLSEILELDENTLYWCTRTMYNQEQDDEKQHKLYDNALIAEKVLKNE